VVVPTYIKLGLLGPSFAKIGDRIKNQDENSIEEKKEGTKLVFSPILVLREVSSPYFWICLTSALTATCILYEIGTLFK
jgi:hypothetical protein